MSDAKQKQLPCELFTVITYFFFGLCVLLLILCVGWSLKHWWTLGTPYYCTTYYEATGWWWTCLMISFILGIVFFLLREGTGVPKQNRENEKIRQEKEIKHLEQRWRGSREVQLICYWYTTVLYDLQLPNIPLFLQEAKKCYGQYLVNIKEDPSFFVGLGVGNLFGGTFLGGQVHYNFAIKIFMSRDTSDYELLMALLLNARGLWQALHGIPTNVEEAEEYAKRFLQRYPEPKADPYQGPVSPYDWIRVS